MYSMNTNPVYIVDDDTDDQHFVEQIWQELKYENMLKFFRSGEGLLVELQSRKISPFLILCDVNVPRGGFELKARLLEDELLNYKSVPFIFWSTFASKEQIRKAFMLSANGFFIKGNTYKELKESLSDIMKYWQRSKQPEMAG